ncbi:hypothetical protein [Pseudophaeobacter sp.]|uniref:hypothetical protein n=1 Tax=Pseudophaeobacter sp. TaxID=1971739 RepID=UPI0032672E82
MTNEQLETLLGAFLERSPHLADLLFTDQGVHLMGLDGRISEFVHRHFCDQAVPVLSVHDSYLIDYTRVGELKRVSGGEGVDGYTKQAKAAVGERGSSVVILETGAPRQSRLTQADSQEKIEQKPALKY